MTQEWKRILGISANADQEELEEAYATSLWEAKKHIREAIQVPKLVRTRAAALRPKIQLEEKEQPRTEVVDLEAGWLGLQQWEQRQATQLLRLEQAQTFAAIGRWMEEQEQEWQAYAAWLRSMSTGAYPLEDVHSREILPSGKLLRQAMKGEDSEEMHRAVHREWCRWQKVA